MFFHLNLFLYIVIIVTSASFPLLLNWTPVEAIYLVIDKNCHLW